MNALPVTEIGSEHVLNTLNETEGPMGLLCYCPRCRYKRGTLERVQTNFYHGFAFFGLWIWNVCLYVMALRLSDQYEFSESIAWEHRGEVLLQQDLDDDTTVVGGVIREHVHQQREFDRVCGWSLSALLVLSVLVWVMAMLLTS